MDSNNYEDRLHQLTNGFRDTQIILTAYRLGVFECLGAGSKSLSELASVTDSDQRALRILCDALVALGLLIKNETRYSIVPGMQSFLCDGFPNSLGGLFLHKAALYETWGRLYDVVKTGKPASKDVVDPRFRITPEKFARAMMSAAGGIARETAGNLDLSGKSSLLDIGGGPGIYAIELAKKNPGLHVSIMDDAETLKIAGENVRNAGLSSRISLLPGNVLQDEIKGSFDCVFVSNVIHMFSAEQNQRLIAHAARHLNPRGIICVKDFLVDETKASPLLAAVFAVNMLVNTEGGECYNVREISSWMEEQGFFVFNCIPLSDRDSLVLACRNEKCEK